MAIKPNDRILIEQALDAMDLITPILDQLDKVCADHAASATAESGRNRHAAHYAAYGMAVRGIARRATHWIRATADPDRREAAIDNLLAGITQAMKP